MLYYVILYHSPLLVADELEALEVHLGGQLPPALARLPARDVDEQPQKCTSK